MHNRQFLSRQYLSRLRTRMVRPRPNRIELEIDHPMAQCPAPFAGTLVCQRQVVVRVGIFRHQAYRFAIRFYRIRQPLQLVEHVA